MSSTLSDSTRQFVRKRANYHCEYCKAAELLMGLKCEIDHIIPRSRGGSNELDNLCAACTFCNGRKYIKVGGVDPNIGQIALLFNPREQEWPAHFRWSGDGTIIIGTTPCGRAAVEALQLNDSLRVAARSIWVHTKRHPPT